VKILKKLSSILASLFSIVSNCETYIKHPVAEPGYLVFLVEETLRFTRVKTYWGFSVLDE